jgi:hypothetical protein
MVILIQDFLLENIKKEFEKENGYWDVHQMPAWLRAKGFDGRYGYVNKKKVTMTAYFKEDKVATMFVLRWS